LKDQRRSKQATRWVAPGTSAGSSKKKEKRRRRSPANSVSSSQRPVD
jgi:hypothetical protein